NPAWSQLPIVALTADAMKGTKEKVLQAGMNDYLSKPLDVGHLYATVLRWAGANTAAPAMAATAPNMAPLVATPTVPPKPGQALPGIDLAAALRVCNKDRQLLDKLLRMFCQNQADFGARFVLAQQDTSDPQAAQRCAHSLKGSAGNIGAKVLASAAAVLEQACREAAAPQQQALLCQALLRELDVVLSGLAQGGYAQPDPEATASDEDD
ncbi:MAG: Hpt domain-containing protein, partial [Burkholderiaceae bacterium]